MTITLLHGDALELLATLAAGSVQTIVTSPPYYGLRRYSDDPRELGHEATPALYVARLVAILQEARRVLRDDGTLWLNLGDSRSMNGTPGMSNLAELGERYRGGGHKRDEVENPARRAPAGLPAKNLLGMPWRVAFALQDDGWYLRSDIVWSKPNCMPESVRDRPTSSHEYLFLLSKSARYYYDADAIRENFTAEPKRRGQRGPGDAQRSPDQRTDWPAGIVEDRNYAGRNKRSVWTIATQPYAGAHFATMPEALIEPCILAGSAAQACEHCGAGWRRMLEKTGDLDTSAKGSKFDAGKTGINGQGRVQAGDRYLQRDLGFAPGCACAENTGSASSVILDPFAGSGTVGKVAQRFQRSAILIDLNAAYLELQEQRNNGVQVEMQL